MPDTLPLLLEPAELEMRLARPGVAVIDLSRADIHAQAHIPGAVHLEYVRLLAGRPPVMGLLPEPAQLSQTLAAAGLRPETHVVAYDEEGGGKAARLLWTLAAAGHRNYSLLNGGLQAWIQEGRACNATLTAHAPGGYPVHVYQPDVVVDGEYILAHLGDPGVCLLDCRTPEEYDGRTTRALRGGRIPGAVNFNWVNAMDANRAMKLRPADELRGMLTKLGVTPDREVLAYCQTHHRSAHTWLVLKLLGYPRVRGYPGSWSEWGNNPTLPIE